MKIRSLTKQTEFRKIYEDGRKLVGKYCVIYLLPSPDPAKAVVASKKIGGAVQRNRAKRVLREVLATTLFNNINMVNNLNVALRSTSNTKDKPLKSIQVIAVARRSILKTNTVETAIELQKMLSQVLVDKPH